VASCSCMLSTNLKVSLHGIFKVAPVDLPVLSVLHNRELDLEHGFPAPHVFHEAVDQEPRQGHLARLDGFPQPRAHLGRAPAGHRDAEVRIEHRVEQSLALPHRSVIGSRPETPLIATEYSSDIWVWHRYQINAAIVSITARKIPHQRSAGSSRSEVCLLPDEMSRRRHGRGG
jgi:hypothetical protein